MRPFGDDLDLREISAAHSRELPLQFWPVTGDGPAGVARHWRTRGSPCLPSVSVPGPWAMLAVGARFVAAAVRVM